MTVDQYFRFFLWLAAIFLLGLAARGLWTGRLKLAGQTYLRSAEPAGFWRELILLLISALLLGGGLLIVGPGGRAGHDPGIGLIFSLVIFLPVVLRAAWTRELCLAGGQIRRSDRPQAFWTMTLFALAMCLLAVFVLIDGG